MASLISSTTDFGQIQPSINFRLPFPNAESSNDERDAPYFWVDEFNALLNDQPGIVPGSGYAWTEEDEHEIRLEGEVVVAVYDAQRARIVATNVVTWADANNLSIRVTF
jgi:hypothetical protein